MGTIVDTSKISMASSCLSSPRVGADYDFDDNDSLDGSENRAFEEQGSDEDTEDASETDVAKEEEFTEIKEQMYQQKLSQLKKLLKQLEDATLPEYMKKVKKLENQHRERLRINEIWHKSQEDAIEREYVNDKKNAVKEFEEKKIHLKENLILELEDKRRHIELERVSMEITGDSMEVKQVNTRKLRRRPNEPTPQPEKRRKTSPTQLNYYLEDEEILEDLAIINKVSGKMFPARKSLSTQPCLTPNTPTHPILYDAWIEDGRLYFDKKWFHRNQPVYIESKDAGKVSAVISAVGTQEIWLRRTSDNGKVRVYTRQLQQGKYILTRRN